MSRDEFEDKIDGIANVLQQYADQLGEIAGHLAQVEYADYAANPTIFDGDADDLADVVSKVGEYSDALSDLSHEW
ncbi:hypothetical protein [Bifidobacterium callitrichos]|uniref:Uncharacterized protein n=1 Tax=Bifidobacterium callitrichos DSM 23973 TaxID=1437609 RepID=A0A087AC41_9BIFI|nr:hypothetical protein [Bifidobacterium callitrichos]KFI56341.1 hypothetical protein BCAL_0367 [Bifidobacterium callitrichos DSM 23973]